MNFNHCQEVGKGPGPGGNHQCQWQGTLKGLREAQEFLGVGPGTTHGSGSWSSESNYESDHALKGPAAAAAASNSTDFKGDYDTSNCSTKKPEPESDTVTSRKTTRVPGLQPGPTVPESVDKSPQPGPVLRPTNLLPNSRFNKGMDRFPKPMSSHLNTESNDMDRKPIPELAQNHRWSPSDFRKQCQKPGAMSGINALNLEPTTGPNTSNSKLKYANLGLKRSYTAPSYH